jgi:phosphate:Na+ symporter
VESTIVMINLFGAVALLLFGLAQVKDGMTRAFGVKLRSGLALGTRGPFRSFFAGFVATVALQSSTATALMIASFVEKNLVRARMAQIVLLGANVGTAVTAWLVATGIESISPLIILVGVVLYKSSSSTARQGLGSALVGIGLMLLSLHLLSLATEPMRQSPALAAFLQLLDGAWPAALAFSTVLAIVSSSSLAVVVLILSLSAMGILSPALTVILVLGANLGGAVWTINTELLVRGVGCLAVLPFAGQVADLLALLPVPAAKLPVDVHLVFNLVVALVLWPLSGPLSRLMEKLVPEDKKEETGPKYLDDTALSSPVVALSGATREVLRVGDLIEAMLIRTMRAFNDNNLTPLKDIGELERQVDALQQEVKIYLSRLGRQGVSGECAARSIIIIDYAINLEHVGDIIEKGLQEQVRKKIVNGLKFSDDGYKELDNLFNLTIENLRIAQTIFVTRDAGLARQLMEVKVDVRRMEKQSSERHLERLRDGRLDSLQTSSLHLDMLRDLKRVNAHLVSVAYPILDESGLLTESRLRNSTS